MITIPLTLEPLEQLIIKPWRSQVTWLLRLKENKKQKNSKKNLKKGKFYQKIAKVCDIKKFKNNSITIKNLSVTHYQTP